MMRKVLGAIVFIMLMAALGPPGYAGSVSVKNRASLSTEYDDNVFKTDRDVEGDFLGRLYYDFLLNVFPTKNNRILFDYQGGIKKYLEIADQDTFINRVQIGYTNTSIKQTFLGTDLSFKMRNISSGEEDYDKFIGEVFAGRQFGEGITGQIRSGLTRFNFHPYNYYDYWLQRHGIIMEKAFGPRFIFGTQYFFQEKHFPFDAYERIGTETGEIFLRVKDEQRLDTLHEPAIFLQYSQWLLVDFSYLMQINNSNSYGDNYYNHRFTLALSKALFKNTHIHILGITQFRDSFEKVLIPHSYSIEEDDENYNSIRAKVTQKLTKHISMDVGYSRFWTTYSNQDLNFIKNLYSLGISFSF